ncbi:hypothetical protein [Paraflavitalea pollutisoli]|uniref:hypothetical protein n=1 Tax=Paraflavitalea pollutisoli TaxID=3034143 RepID=UPI0023EDE81B|nr:hypothetical protein [Paraflavitalea sp. H1-2-19X]
MCETEKLGEHEWKAEITYIQRNSGKNSQTRHYMAHGPSEEAAINHLKADIQTLFLIRNEQIGWKDVVFSLFRWVHARGKVAPMVIRSIVVLLLAMLLSLFLFDWQKSPIQHAKKNISFLLQDGSAPPFADTAFLTEQFIASALQNTDSIFWASNVSFRNLQVGNKANLETFLAKKKQFKLVLLDTGSVLAHNDYLSTFSRTAKKQDISNTINSLLNEENGSLKKYGDKSIHQLYLSAYSPIVPLLRVDDTIYVSFPIHTDAQRKQGNYGGPYLKFHINSRFGEMLQDHFKNMINGQDTRSIYP